MKNSSILISVKSHLLRQGLIQSIDEMDVRASIYECDNWDCTKEKLNIFYINYLFIDPDILKGDITQIVSFRSENTSVRLIGLFDKVKKEKAAYFDHLLFVDDSKSEIKKKLSEIFRQNSEQSEKNTDLSAREKTILTLVAKGKTNQEIADELFISTHTVISHRKNITRKLGIKTVAGLAVYAVINNLADANDLK